VLAGQSHMQLRFATTRRTHLLGSGIGGISMHLGMRAWCPLFPISR